MLAWKAASYPPPGRAVIAGLVPASMPRPRSWPTPFSTTQRWPVLAWNAASYPAPNAKAVIAGLVPASMPRPRLWPVPGPLEVHRIFVLAWNAMSALSPETSAEAPTGMRAANAAGDTALDASNATARLAKMPARGWMRRMGFMTVSFGPG